MMILSVVFGAAFMQFAQLGDADLIARSDLIVIAELVGQTQLATSPDRPVSTFGVLQVEEVLKGAVPSFTNMLLLEQPTPGGLRSSSDIIYRKGQRGLWFLRVRAPGDPGPYLADHPQRFVPVTDKRIDTFRTMLKSQRRKP